MLDSQEQEWIKREQLLIAEREHPKIQPDELDCEDCLGSDLNSPYEREHKVKGM